MRRSGVYSFALIALAALGLGACDAADDADGLDARSTEAVLAMDAAERALPDSHGGHPVRLSAHLNGHNEVGVGDRDGSGVIGLAYKHSICYHLDAQNLDSLVAGHIHQGTAGHNGPVVVTLFDGATPPDAHPHGHHGISARGCVAADSALVADIAHAPHSFYVNVHTVAYPDGAIRGQLESEHGGHGGGH